MKRARFEVYQDKAGAHRWRLIAANGRILATGEGHTRQADAHRAIDTMKATAAVARLPGQEKAHGLQGLRGTP